MRPCSVVVPVHGRAGLTRRCLDGLLAARPPLLGEVVVVVDGAPDAGHEALAAAYGDPVRWVFRAENGGFGAACNDGAWRAEPAHDLVFLNNDAFPGEGWLEALVAAADAAPDTAVVGARLLYPDGTVQHAGVALGQDGHPRNLYVGFPGDHPAVTRSRRLQAVTAACMLVRRRDFEAVGGFDEGFRNGLEDVDLCLRLGERGREVRYAPDAVAVHLESVTRGRRCADIEAGIRRFRERWDGRALRDDLTIWAADGLLGVAYDEAHPVRLDPSPLLAAVDDGARADARERLLVARARQATDLLRDVVHLTLQAVEGRNAPGRSGDRPDAAAPLPVDVDEALEEIEDRLVALQRRLAEEGGASPTPSLAYRASTRRLRALVEEVVPPGSTVGVVSRGDDALVALRDRRGRHVPEDARGRWAGHHPADGAEALAAVRRLERSGGAFLVLPESTAWWLDAYPELRDRLRASGPPRAAEAGVGAVYALASAPPTGAPTPARPGGRGR